MVPGQCTLRKHASSWKLASYVLDLYNFVEITCSPDNTPSSLIYHRNKNLPFFVMNANHLPKISLFFIYIIEVMNTSDNKPPPRRNATFAILRPEQLTQHTSRRNVVTYRYWWWMMSLENIMVHVPGIMYLIIHVS